MMSLSPIGLPVSRRTDCGDLVANAVDRAADALGVARIVFVALNDIGQFLHRHRSNIFAGSEVGGKPLHQCPQNTARGCSRRSYDEQAVDREAGRVAADSKSARVHSW